MQTAAARLPAATSERRARNASRSVRSSPANSARSTRCRGEQPLDGRPLVDPGGRADLQHLAPPVRLETGLPRGCGDLARVPLGGLLVGGTAPVERLDRSLVLETQPGPVQRGALQLANELARGKGAFGGRGIDDRLLGARGQQLEAVVARVGELVDPDQPSRLDRAPARHAGDERVALPPAPGARRASPWGRRRTRDRRRSAPGSRRRHRAPRRSRGRRATARSAARSCASTAGPAVTAAGRWRRSW